MTARALLIGNWDYADAEGGMAKLRGPEYDLTTLKQALTDSRFGLFQDGDVTIGRNLKAQDLRQELGRAAMAARAGDLLLIYYSGHGVRLGDGQRLGLVGVDVPFEQRDYMSFNTSELSGWLDNTRASRKVLILDCCYSGQYRGAGLVDDDVLKAFGQGTVVLASGGNQPVPDQPEDGGPSGPSAFTSALATVLTDGKLAGLNGFLTAEDVKAALDGYEPRLSPRPKGNVNTQGTIGLAKRPQIGGAASTIRGWPDKLTVLPVSVHFGENTVTAAWDQDDDGMVRTHERDVSLLDGTRLAAIRRLGELADAVMRAKEYGTPTWQERARQALGTAGANLFEAALPPTLKDFLRKADGQDFDGEHVVRLDLTFDPPWSQLAEYPWEYLQIPTLNGIEPKAAAPHRLLVTRASNVKESLGPPPEMVDVGVSSSLGQPYSRLTERLIEELVAMPTVSTAITPAGQPATWADFRDLVDGQPEHIILCAPLRRMKAKEVGVTVELGFAGEEPDWWDVAEVANQLATIRRLRSVTLVSVAADIGMDAIRAAPRAAEVLNARLRVAVVFVCHTAGLEGYVRDEAPSEQRTFAGLLMAALSTKHPFDESVWYARERVLRFIPGNLQPTLGLPGLFHGSAAAERSSAPGTGTRDPGQISRSRPAGRRL